MIRLGNSPSIISAGMYEFEILLEIGSFFTQLLIWSDNSNKFKYMIKLLLFFLWVLVHPELSAPLPCTSSSCSAQKIKSNLIGHSFIHHHTNNTHWFSLSLFPSHDSNKQPCCSICCPGYKTSITPFRYVIYFIILVIFIPYPIHLFCFLPLSEMPTIGFCVACNF